MQLRNFFTLFIYLIYNSLIGQTTCNVCNEVILDGSSFPSGLQYQWVCTDGQTSNQRKDTLVVTQDMTCTLIVTDTLTGCVAQRILTVNNCDSCTVEVNINVTGNILLTSLDDCEGTPSYQWQKYNGATWDNVGSNSTTHNTSGVAGTYRVTVICDFSCQDIDTIVYDGCVFSIVYFGDSRAPNAPANFMEAELTNGCTDFKTISLHKETSIGSGVWNLITTFTSLNNIYSLTGTGYGSYRLTVEGCGCTKQAFYEHVADPPPPCSSFVGSITVPSPRCQGTSVIFSVATNSQPIASTSWAVNGVTLPSNAYDADFVGTFVVTGTLTSIYGCTASYNKTLIINNCCTGSNSLTPLNSNVCTNQNITYTASATGTSPFVHSWFYKLGAGSWVSSGVGVTKVFNFNTAGTYTIKVETVDDVNCNTSSQTNLSVNNCVDCTCNPTLVLSGCTLNASFTGGGCVGYTYNLEYAPLGGSFSSIQTGAATNFTYNPVANGNYRVVITKTDCTTQTTPVVTVTCYVPPCSSNPTLVLSSSSLVRCQTDTPVTITGNVIGGSATTATATENGLGSVAITFVNSTTFTFVYTPNAGDLGTLVTINFTTNNPNGSPCIPAIASFGIDFRIPPDPIITSSSSSMCPNSVRNITFTPPGGTLTVNSGPGVLVGTLLTATGTGSISLSYSVSINGCTAVYGQTIAVGICTPTLSVSGCTITATFTGTCSSHNYNFEYSANGTTGWTTVDSGIASNFTYGAIDGYYRLTTSKAGCTNIVATATVSNPVTITRTGWEFLGDDPPRNSDYTTYCGGLSTDWIDAMYQNSGGIFAAVQCASPSFTTSTYTSNIPVTWTYTPVLNPLNCVILSNTATSVTLKFEWIQGNSFEKLCVGGAGISSNYRVKGFLIATDACGHVVFRTYLVAFTVG